MEIRTFVAEKKAFAMELIGVTSYVGRGDERLGDIIVACFPIAMIEEIFCGIIIVFVWRMALIFGSLCFLRRSARSEDMLLYASALTSVDK